MHLLIGLAALAGALAVWYWRITTAHRAGSELLNAASDLRAAARRLRYQHKHDTHPADSIEDPRLAAAGIAVAVATMDAPISQAEIAKLTGAARRIFDTSEAEATDITAFGRWIADQCGTPGEAVRRLAKVIARTAGPEAGPDLVAMVEETATADGRELGETEEDAIAAIRRGLGLARSSS